MKKFLKQILALTVSVMLVFSNVAPVLSSETETETTDELPTEPLAETEPDGEGLTEEPDSPDASDDNEETGGEATEEETSGEETEEETEEETGGEATEEETDDGHIEMSDLFPDISDDELLDAEEEETEEEILESILDFEPVIEESVSLDNVEEAPEYEYSFETVFENSEATLLIDKSVNNLRVVSKATGTYFDTKVMNGQVGNNVIKDTQKSDFVISYYRDTVKSNVVSVDNYTMSVQLGQIEYTPIENGIRCSFVVGEANRIQLGLFPMYISMERLEEFVLQHLTDRERMEFLDEYYTETTTRVIRNWNSLQSDGSPTLVPIPRLRKLNEFFYEKGTYTLEELEKDNLEWGEVATDVNILINIDVEYRLDGGDLIVAIPMESLEFNEKYPISDLTLTPYLLSGDTYDEGYLFVPDGSGGIINFNTDNLLVPSLTMPIYGKDPLNSPYLYTEEFKDSTLPVIGMKKNDMAILGIIEEGAGIATVNANIAGRMDEFNKVNVRFDLLYMQRVYLSSGRGQTMPRYLNEPYSGNIVMRYKLLEGNDANYTGMAKAYKEYLKGNGLLKENPTPEDAPLFIEMIASTLKKKMFLGINYTEYVSMTSFDNAIEILKSLKNEGVKNTVLEYSDFVNNGTENLALTNIKIINSIGGKKGLQRLIDYTESDNSVAFYPSVRINTVFEPKGLPKTTALSRYIDNGFAFRFSLDIMSRTTFNAAMPSYILSPNYINNTYASKFSKNLEKLNITNIALNDAATLLYGNYGRNEQLMRSDGEQLMTDTFNKLDESFSLLFTNANAYAFASASHISDLPASFGGRRVIDYEVPFVQLVLENDIQHSLPAYNDDAMLWNGFEEYMLKAVETKSSLKFIFTQEDEFEFYNSLVNNNNNTRTFFMTRYDRWQDKIGAYYAEYNAFYQKVKNAEVTNHEHLSNGLVKVTYSNGVTVYANYSNSSQEIDGVIVGGISYVIKDN